MNSLEKVRTEIENIDREIVGLIKKRNDLGSLVLKAKVNEGLDINDEKQNKVVLERAVCNAINFNLDIDPIKSIFKILIEMNIEHQQELSGKGKFP